MAITLSANSPSVNLEECWGESWFIAKCPTWGYPRLLLSGSWALKNVRLKKKRCPNFYVVSTCDWKNEKPKTNTTNNGTQEQYRTPSLFFFISFSPLIGVSVGVHVCLSVHFAYVCVHVPDSEDLWRERLDCHWARVHARQHFLFQYFALCRHLAAQLSHIPQIHTGTHSFINPWIM